VGPRRPDDRDRVGLDLVADGDRPDLVAQGQDRGGVGDRPDRVERLRLGAVAPGIRRSASSAG
jgi:hypothetical protein